LRESLGRLACLGGLLALLLCGSADAEAKGGSGAVPGSACVHGLATYYGRRFEGRRTASGEHHRPERLTAAHPTLPLGTRVHVRNVENGREVTVVVNDRCRCRRRDPHIDLSRAAARELGFLGKGTARVRMRPFAEGEAGPDRAGCPDEERL